MTTFQRQADLRRRAFIQQLLSILLWGACGAAILIWLDPLSIVWR